jgi:hypothetical protein
VAKYVLRGCKELRCENGEIEIISFPDGQSPDADAEFWGIYALDEDSEPIETNIADFVSKTDALFFMSAMEKRMRGGDK